MLLIISNSTDATVEFARGAIERRGVPYRRLDTDRYPADVKVRLSNDTSALRLPDGPLDLREVTAIWWRRPIPPTLERRDKAVAHWVSEEARLALDAAWRPLTDVSWVNHPDNNRRAQEKVGALREAAALGLPVLPWLVTNEATEAAEFAATNPPAIVAKPLGAGRIDDERTFWTSVIDDPAMVAELGPEPYLLQRFVRRRLDIRVTVIGGEVYAVAIDTTARPEARADWRLAAADARYRPHELPAQIGRRCLELTRAFGLLFAAIDFAWDGDTYWFLEINPNGQWAWLEERADVPLSRALADLFAGHV